MIIIGCSFKGVIEANNLTYDLCAKAWTTSSDRALKHDDTDKEITHIIFQKKINIQLPLGTRIWHQKIKESQLQQQQKIK